MRAPHEIVLIFDLDNTLIHSTIDFIGTRHRLIDLLEAAGRAPAPRDAPVREAIARRGALYPGAPPGRRGRVRGRGRLDRRPGGGRRGGAVHRVWPARGRLAGAGRAAVGVDHRPAGIARPAVRSDLTATRGSCM